MFLYKFEATFADGTTAGLVILHESEEKAFHSAQNELERYFIPNKPVRELAIIEKKPAGPGRGYVVEA
ncbi:uncharacterized protein DUF3906 [Aneurinibacillus soli]|uniref:Uncharacterized protein n=1 Tax=Aneurinibacillus soli TaxID=1500254 RepID=A0A0U5B5L2_9BACL|nr:DUF3906 family protein [Aneurinibacillus soli]PYE61864.1 uncharacterized protein DUF3906 [Aneurinibacillus soli]BAU29680.1 hypothetical protein CB4_03917 [Aneurinibacillus soli]